MCLNKVDLKPKTNRKTGYKVVDKKHNRLYPPCCGIVPYKVGRWMTDTKCGRIWAGIGRYPTGYHIFLSLAGARAWTTPNGCVVKVKFEDVVATGTQDIWGYRTYRVIVARKLLIPKKELI